VSSPSPALPPSLPCTTGATLASCGADRTIRLWSRTGSGGTAAAAIGGGTKANTSPAPFVCTAVLEESASRTIRTLAWSPCGARLAAACFDATTAVWEREGGPAATATASWRQAAVLQGHESEVKGAAWSPSGAHLATCARDRSVWVWEVVTDGAGGAEYECADVKQGHGGDVKAVAWHPAPEAVAGCAAPGGGILVSASYDESLRVWADAGDEWVCAQVLGVGEGGHAGTVWCLSFEGAAAAGAPAPAPGSAPAPAPGPAPGPRLASGGGEGGVRVWECTPRPPGSAPDDDVAWRVDASIPAAHGGRPVYGVSWAPAGANAPARLATGGGDDAVRVWEEEERRVDGASSSSSFVQVAAAKAEPESSEVNAVAWCPADRDLVAAAGDDGVVRVWRVVEV